MSSLRPVTRIVLALAVLSMGAAYVLPLWEIQLWAPQYPEGLNMKIWLNRLTGAFDIINGINHYIGMKPIRQEMFPEFGYMDKVLGFLMLLGMVPVITGKRVWLHVFLGVLLVGGGLGIYDFHRWSYDYGHDLDPKAAISVPGMSYDPPLIGYKNLLNFVAYSGPDQGGWVLVAAGAVVFGLWTREQWLARRKKAAVPVTSFSAAAVLLPLLVLLAGCEAGPQAINYGKDECAGCKMILVDQRYGTEFISGKGKVFKFDDVNCLVGFLGKEPAKGDAAGQAVVVDFRRANEFVKVGEAVFLKHPGLRSPMGSHIAGFASRAELDAVRKELGGDGQVMRWAEVMKEP